MLDNRPDDVISRPSKQQKMAEDSNDELRHNLPNNLIIGHILPFVDRSTWDNLVVANREIYEGSRNIEAPWPVGALRGVGYEGDEINGLFFSSDGNYLCVHSSQEHGHTEQQRIRMWHNVVGSCGHVTFDVSDGFEGYACLWNALFSPVENLLVSLHFDHDLRKDAFRLWEVNTGGLVFKVEVRLDEGVVVLGCTFSRDGRQLILCSRDSSLWIYSVPDAQLIKVIHLVGNRHANFDFIGITADGCQAACIDRHGMNQTNHHVRKLCLESISLLVAVRLPL
jgi:WD40 repeat protein